MKSEPVSAPPPPAPTPPANVPIPPTTPPEGTRVPLAPNNPNGAPRPGPARLPKAQPWGKRTKILLALGSALVVVLAVGGTGALLVAKASKVRQADLVP